MLRFRCLVCILILTSSSFAATKPPAKPTPAPAIPKVVRAQAFELTDAAGKTRAWLGTSDDGATLLKLLDAEGKPKVLVDSNGEIKVLDDSGTARVRAGSVDGFFGFEALDDKGTTRIGAHIGTDVDPAITVWDSEGRIRTMLTVTDDMPAFILNDGKEDGARIAFHVGETPIMSLWDTSGKQRTSYSLTGDGAPLLQMTNPGGDVCAELSAGDDQPLLYLSCPTSGMSARMGFSSAEDLSMALLNDGIQMAGMELNTWDPYIGIGFKSGDPAAGMWISDEGVPYFSTGDEDGLPIWESDGL